MEIIFIATIMQAIIVIILVAIVLVGGKLVLHGRTHKLLQNRSTIKKIDTGFLDFDNNDTSTSHELRATVLTQSAEKQSGVR